jgi:hypothetical protein
MVPRLGLGVLLALTVNECQQLRPEAVGFQEPKRGKSAKIANERRARAAPVGKGVSSRFGRRGQDKRLATIRQVFQRIMKQPRAAQINPPLCQWRSHKQKPPDPRSAG